MCGAIECFLMHVELLLSHSHDDFNESACEYAGHGKLRTERVGSLTHIQLRRSS